MGRIVALVLVLALSVWCATAEAGRRVALVIGNGGYGEAAKLPNPPNDAREVAAALERLGFDVTLAIDVTQTQLLSAVDSYAQNLTSADAALLFYAGHGIQLEGRNYLLPVDIKIENERSVRYGAVDISEVVAEMERASPVNIILLDACRNNPFVAELKRSLKTRALDVGKGLAPIKAQSSGTIISFAAAAGEVAADGQGEHSPYTAALLQEIEKPGVELALTLRRVAGRVIDETKGEQRPELLVRLVNEFYMKGAAEPEAKPQVTAKVEQPPLVVVEKPQKPVVIADADDKKRYAVPRAQWGRIASRPADALDWIPAKPVTIAESGANDMPGAANTVPLDAVLQLTIAPRGDNDMFRFETRRAGVLTVSGQRLPAALNLAVRVLDANLQVLSDWQTAPRPGGDVGFEFDLPRPGPYYLVVADGSNDAESTDAVALDLKFAPAQDGYEANATIGTAWPIEATGELKASIFPRGDQDWYQIWVEQPGRFGVHAHDVPETLDLSFRLHDGNGAVLYDWQTAPRPGGEVAAVFDFKLPGAYFIELADSYNDQRNAKAYTLTTAYTPSADIYEPNDSFATAAPIPAAGSRRLTILPRGDADWFRFDVDHPGELRLAALDVPNTLDIAFRVYNRDKVVIADWMVPPRPGGDTQGTVDLTEPGTYYVEITDSYNDQADIANFRFETAFTPEPDQYEPNNSAEAATLIRPGGEFLFNILPRGDADWFAVKTEAPGELAVSIDEGPPDLDLYYRIWNADRQVIRDWVAPYAKGGLTEGFADLPSAGLYFIETTDGNNDGRSALPATLQTRFTAAVDAYEPDNTFGSAWSAPLPGSGEIHILPLGDADWRKVDAPGPGELTVSISNVPEPLDIYFRIFDANGNASGWFGPAKTGAEFSAPVPIAAAGAVRIEFTDGYNDGRSPKPIAVSWRFAAKP